MRKVVWGLAVFAMLFAFERARAEGDGDEAMTSSTPAKTEADGSTASGTSPQGSASGEPEHQGSAPDLGTRPQRDGEAANWWTGGGT